MDLNTIAAVAHPTTRDQLPVWTAGDAWLAGGTWLFSEPQTHLNRLIDLTDMVATGMLFRLTLNLARGRRVEQFPNSFKSAILAPTADTARFARMFQQLNTNPQIDVQVFATLERAEAWLRAKD